MRTKKAIKNVMAGLLLEVVVLIYGFIVPKIIISRFGSTSNGLISSVTQFLGYISLLESGFGPVVKAAFYKPLAKKDKGQLAKLLKASEKFFRTIASIFVVYIVILMFVYPLFVDTGYGFWYTVSIILILSITTFAEYFFGMTYSLFLQADQKGYVSKYIQIGTYILTIIGILFAVRFEWCNLVVIKLVTSLCFALRPIIQNFYVKRKYKIDLNNVDGDYKLDQRWDGLLQHIAYTVHTKTDVTVLTILGNLKQVSVYGIYYIVIKAIRQFINALTSGTGAMFGNMIANEEHDNLRNKFSIYQILFFSILSVMYGCTIVLVIPFLRIYTHGFADAAMYLSEATFGIILIFSQFFYSLRSPYALIIKAAGHFKQISKGAIVEAVLNIVISVALVIKLGLVGVAIGTIISTLIRTVELIIHSHKYILENSIWSSIKKFIVLGIELSSIILICIKLKLNVLEVETYLCWIKHGFIVFSISLIITLIFDFIFFKNEMKDVFGIIKFLFRKKSNKGKEKKLEESNEDTKEIEA